MSAKDVVAVEVTAKYPPLGLMKIAQYHGPRGKRDNVKFIKGTDRAAASTAWDRIRHRRCLLPIDSFFEWQAIKRVKAKRPFSGM